MRDEIDARIWAEHHEAFTRSIDAGLRRLSSRLERVRLSEGAVAHMIAFVLAAGLSLVSIGATVA